MISTAEFRGCDMLCVAEVTADTDAAYTTGAVTHLCEVAQIAKTVDQSSETHYYDNKAAVTIRAIGADSVQLIVPALVLSTLAKITGASIDAQTGAYIDRGAKNAQKFYALGYRIKLTDGTYRYVWKQKGMFVSIPDETSQTESNAVNTNNQTVQFNALDTNHEFTNGGSSRSVYCDERDGLANLSTWFSNVKTPDNLPPTLATVTALTLSESTLAITTGSSDTATYTITPNTAVPSIVSSNPEVASVSVSGTTITVTGNNAGTAIVTATAGSKSAAITVTVSDL